MAQIIDGKLVSSKLRESIKDEVLKFKEESGITPGLAVVLVGDDPASCVYVRNKHKACVEAGMNSFEIRLPKDVEEAVLLEQIDTLNNRTDVHGILVQLPLPAHLNEKKIINAISPYKDVDAFHPVNTGRILIGDYDFLPCTPAGVMSLLDYYGVQISGKNCVVVGRSNIVGKPMALLLLERNGTVTVCHSKTVSLRDYTSRADILVVAVGRPNFIKGDQIKEGAVVIDVGINRLPDGKLCGDVDFATASEKASLITPVPGGVGPMTITTLLTNTLRAAKHSALK